MFNKLDNLPFLGYRIIEKLFENEVVWKILKYNDYDCLSKPNLTTEEKSALIWKNQTDQEKYRVFLTQLIQNIVTESSTILKIYDCAIEPKTHQISTVGIQIDIMTGAKAVMVDYEDCPCNRITVLEHEIIKTLNGIDIGGIGFLQFNKQANWRSQAQSGVNNERNYAGSSIVLTIEISALRD